MRAGLVLEQSLAEVPGGTARYAVELARALAADAPDGCSVHSWVALHVDRRPASVPGVHGPHRLPLGSRALAVAWERGMGPAPRDVDVVHAPTLLVPPRRGRPLVVTIHDAVPWTHPETLTARGVAFHLRMAARAAREADVVIVPTQAVADELAPLLHLGDRVRVIPHGVADGLRVPGDAADRRRRLGVPDRYAVAVGTLEPRKGLDVALAAFTHPDLAGVDLLVAGPSGWGDVDLDTASTTAGLAPGRARALGRLDDADLAAVLDGALALVAPSRAEGFGLPVLEAMALGVPVVVSSAPALVEVAGGAATVVPVGDAVALAGAVVELASDAARRAELARLGRARASGFTWSAAAAATWAAYFDAAGTSPTAG